MLASKTKVLLGPKTRMRGTVNFKFCFVLFIGSVVCSQHNTTPTTETHTHTYTHINILKGVQETMCSHSALLMGNSNDTVVNGTIMSSLLGYLFYFFFPKPRFISHSILTRSSSFLFCFQTSNSGVCVVHLNLPLQRPLDPPFMQQ